MPFVSLRPRPRLEPALFAHSVVVDLPDRAEGGVEPGSPLQESDDDTNVSQDSDALWPEMCARPVSVPSRRARLFVVGKPAPFPIACTHPSWKKFVCPQTSTVVHNKQMHIYAFKFDPLLRNPPGVYGIRFGVGQLKGFYKWGGVMIQGVVGQNLTPQNDPKAL